MATFHPFPRLPFELRAMIWKATVEPRTVVVRLYFGPEDLETRALWFISPTPVPATLQICQEVRNLGLYKKEFTELSQCCQQGEGRYVWLNLDIDIIDVPNDLLDSGVVRTKIQRLKIHPDWYSKTWNGPIMYEVRELKDFVNVRELHIVVDGFGGMDYLASDVCRHSPCPPENIFWVHSEDGQTLTTEKMMRVASDMEAARREAWRQAQ